MQGIKRKRRCQIDCKDHIFQIQTVRGSSSKYDIHLQFCPKYQRDPMPPQHVYPIFNNDAKYYTSAFVLGVDRKVLIKNDLQQIMDHQKQIRDSLEKHNPLIFPRPNSKHTMCSVCKEHYRNYYTHIYSQEHRERISISSYNPHILELCRRYLSLWEGAEQRAEEAEERRKADENTRRQQLAQMSFQEFEEQESSLLDVQRGENLDPLDEEDDDDQEPLFTVKPSERQKKVAPRSVYNETDTVPPKSAKRTRPEIRSKDRDQDYSRKKYVTNHNHVINVGRQIRQRDERRYEKQRDKLKLQKNPLLTKQLRNLPTQKDDAFMVVKTIYISQLEQGQTTVKGVVSTIKSGQTFEKLADRNGVELIKDKDAEIGFIEEEKQFKERQRKDREKDRKEIVTFDNQQKMEKIDCFEKIEKTDRIQRHERIEKSERIEKMMKEKVQKFPFEQDKNDQKNQSKQDHKNDIKQDKSYYNQQNTPTASSTPVHQNPNQNFKINQDHHSRSYDPYSYNGTYKNMPQYRQIQENSKNMPDSYKNLDDNKHSQDIYKNISEGYKSVNQGPYGYCNPYAYGYYEPGGYARNQGDKPYEYSNKQKQKTKKGQKPYQYAPVPYHWSYHPSYYMQPPATPMTPGQPPSTNGDQPSSSKASHGTPGNNSYPGGTNININFPMYMCPPSHPNMNYPPMPASRFPVAPMMHHPYMGYQYPHYIGNHPPQSGRQSEYPNSQAPSHQQIQKTQPAPPHEQQIPSSQNNRKFTRHYLSTQYARNHYPVTRQEQIPSIAKPNNPLK